MPTQPKTASFGSPTMGGRTRSTRSKGIVWTSGTPFSSFDPKTGKFSEYPVAPNKGDRSITWMTGIQTSDTYGLEIDKNDNVGVTGFTPDGKLYKKDGQTGKITGYSAPTAGLPRQTPMEPYGSASMLQARSFRPEDRDIQGVHPARPGCQPLCTRDRQRPPRLVFLRADGCGGAA